MRPIGVPPTPPDNENPRLIRGARIVSRSAAVSWLQNGIRGASSFGRAAFQALPNVQGVERLIREATEPGQVPVLEHALEEIIRALGFAFYFLRSNDRW